MTGERQPATNSLRLRASASALVALPWHVPLQRWSAADAPLVGAPLHDRRHLVRVVQVDGRRWAVKELPRWLDEREHAALGAMERRGVPAARPAGLLTRGPDEDAVLVTEDLPGAVSWRSLLTDLPEGAELHSARVCEAVAVFLVDLHRRGVFWGDCSLATLALHRDGHLLQPVLVDAGTAEVHPSLTDGQRRHDLEILRDNLSGGLLDLAAELRRPVPLDRLLAAVQRVPLRYAELWRTLHARPTLPFARREDAAVVVRRLNRLGYAVDEVRLVTGSGGPGDLELHTVVSDRTHHSAELRRLTGLQAGEGQATVLLADLRAHARRLPAAPASEVARSWFEQVLHPAVERLAAALPPPRDAVQDYCDLLEVRWLLSERAGADVGDDAAVRVLAAGGVPPGAAAELGPARLAG